MDSASGETFNPAPGKSRAVVSGPLFFWIASLAGDSGSTMRCHLIGSSYTGHGFGRCKTSAGTQYTVEF